MESNSPPPYRDSFTEHPVMSSVSGCLFALFVVAVSVAMLFVNAFLCLAVYEAIPKTENELIIARIGQLFFFIVPVLLMIVQWNLLDRLHRLFRNRP